MTHDEIAQLLWPPDFATRGTEVYAVLDGARDGRIHQMVGSSDLAWCCLYAGAVPAELREVAPYLVHLRPQALFTSELLAACWGQAWGIWLVSAAPFEEIRRHLRRFLRVKDERGRKLLFRYYDPIVLAAFLPTCTAAELAELFGPIDAFLVETDAAGEITELWFDGTALRTRSRAVDQGHTASTGPAIALSGAPGATAREFAVGGSTITEAREKTGAGERIRPDPARADSR
jgi:hypothetical protein